jgi:hypothetical protein
VTISTFSLVIVRRHPLNRVRKGFAKFLEAFVQGMEGTVHASRLRLDDDRLLGTGERRPLGCLNDLGGELGDLDEGVAVLLAQSEDLGSRHEALGMALADIFLDIDAQRGSSLVELLWCRSGRRGNGFGVEHGLPLLDGGLEARALARTGREGHRHVPVAVNGADRLVALEAVVVDGVLRDSCQ